MDHLIQERNIRTERTSPLTREYLIVEKLFDRALSRAREALDQACSISI